MFGGFGGAGGGVDAEVALKEEDDRDGGGSTQWFGIKLSVCF